MDKTKINFIVDALMFLGAAVVSGIGFLMKFVLLPGKERAVVYGENVELYFWGLDRHEWGAIHLYIAYVLIALLVLHILLHLKWISAVFARFISNATLRTGAGIVFIVACLFFALFPFIISPEVVHTPRERKQELRIEKEEQRSKADEAEQETKGRGRGRQRR